MCSKALARQTHKNVFVITVDVETALKYTDSGGGPCTLPVRVADMGPDGEGDARVTDDDIVLFFNCSNHYNGFVSQDVANSI